MPPPKLGLERAFSLNHINKTRPGPTKGRRPVSSTKSLIKRASLSLFSDVEERHKSEPTKEEREEQEAEEARAYQNGIEVNGVMLYGMDVELYLKQKSKQDPQANKKILNWISEIIQEQLPAGQSAEGEDDLAAALHSGVVLCKLINAIKPGAVEKFILEPKHIALREEENIKKFLMACQTVLRISKNDLFQVYDLTKRKDLNQVIHTMFVLSNLLGGEEFANGYEVEGKRKKFPQLGARPRPRSMTIDQLLHRDIAREKALASTSASASPVSVLAMATGAVAPVSPSSICLKWSAAVRDEQTLEFLFHNMGQQSGMEEESLLTCVTILKRNGYTHLWHLTQIGMEDLDEMHFPYRFARELEAKGLLKRKGKTKRKGKVMQKRIHLPALSFRFVIFVTLFCGLLTAMFEFDFILSELKLNLK